MVNLVIFFLFIQSICVFFMDIGGKFGMLFFKKFR
jgi:hypothetical protein